MIQLYEGAIGGGKSLKAVADMMERMALGGTVCTNVQINWAKFKEVCDSIHGVDIKPIQLIQMSWEDLSNFHKTTVAGSDDVNSMVVIDEGQLEWNSRDFRDTDKNQRELLSFLTQSRKDNTDVIFITQDVANIDAQFRRLAEFRVDMMDMRGFRVPMLGPICPFHVSLCRQFRIRGNVFQSRQWLWRKKYYGTYETRQKIQDFARSGRVEKVDVGGAPSRRNWGFKRWIVLAVVAFLFWKYRQGTGFGVPSPLDGIGGAVAESNDSVTTQRTVISYPSSDESSATDRGGSNERFQTWSGEEVDLRLLLAGRYRLAHHRPFSVGHFDYAQEPLRVSTGGDWLATAYYTYRVGQRCQYGECVRVEGPIAKIRQPSGRFLIVEAVSERHNASAIRYVVRQLRQSFEPAGRSKDDADAGPTTSRTPALHGGTNNDKWVK